MKRIAVHVGDITRLDVTAIANAANRSLLGGGGVDGAIHRAAGPKLLEECRGLGGCETGGCKLTAGYGLPASYILHCVGPVWQGGDAGEAALLTSCYEKALAIADERRFASLAFPAISTGVYGFPVEKAALIAAHAVAGHLERSDFPEKVLLVCFDEASAKVYREAVAGL
ncbi:O-acetyl-ADP-ribose deacetylase [Tepidicaulis sp.]|uniref:O-acetyl-ADP-ribose deacetylase n=1 Tax=Tepidicaulis sp. TaxID=1920809 RepID=UPI003B59B9D2